MVYADFAPTLTDDAGRFELTAGEAQRLAVSCSLIDAWPAVLDGSPDAQLRIDDREDLEQCHLLYVSGLDSEREQRVIRITRARPILTASDSSTFMGHGGVAAFG